MKKILFTFVVLAVAIITIQALRIDALQERAMRYERNTTALLSDVEHYRTSDSLNAAKASILSLRLGEMEKHRAEDLRTIASLRVKRDELEQVTKMQMRTIAELRGTARDTVIIRDSVEVVRGLYIEVQDEWIDMHGTIDKRGEFIGSLEVRDSLTVVETVQRHRFLGFLWKTKRIKSREIDVKSHNPHTHIMGVESIQIEQ